MTHEPVWSPERLAYVCPKCESLVTYRRKNPDCHVCKAKLDWQPIKEKK
jgi:hypothetical protein